MHDDWYEALMNAHGGLSDTQSEQLDAALLLLLMNQVANLEVLRGCLREARATVLPQGTT
jgi:hypothetical protein